jgi:hypothetical protein
MLEIFLHDFVVSRAKWAAISAITAS